MRIALLILDAPELGTQVAAGRDAWALLELHRARGSRLHPDNTSRPALVCLRAQASQARAANRDCDRAPRRSVCRQSARHVLRSRIRILCAEASESLSQPPGSPSGWPRAEPEAAHE